MKTSLTGSLQAFILARPPVVAFTLSVIAITVAIFLVALHIKDKDLILDSYAQEDWNSFLKHLSYQEFCINIPPKTRSTTEHPSSFVSRPQQITAFFPVRINHTSVNSISFSKPQMTASPLKLVGLLNLKGWKRSCPYHGSLAADNNESVMFALIIPSTTFESDSDAATCVYLSGPPGFFPTVNSVHKTHPVPNAQCPPFIEGVGDGTISSNTSYSPQNSTSSPKCDSQHVMQLSYDSASLNPNIYITEADRIRIVANLLLAGYVLLGIVFVMLLTAVLQGRNLMLVSQHSLLPTKEIIS